MTKHSTTGWVVAAALALAGTAAAQTAARPADQSDLRHQIYVMEGALARAVEFGAQSLNREIRSVMPEALVLAGQAQARGIYLDGYGVFFDVQVPVLRQSVMWSVRMLLDQDEVGIRNALGALKRHVQTVTDPAVRASLENAISRLELQVGPMAVAPAPPAQAARQASTGSTTVGAAVMTPDAPSAPAPAPRAALPVDRLWVKDPSRAYTEAVQRALIDAMIDFSAPMKISAEEWLTVAARDNEPRDLLAPQDPYDEVVTVLLQIRGGDLAAYRAGTIDRDEARRRVTIRQF
ncbi:MAG: hypothetical protein AB1635_18190 [Acidobacteriota bacterium]